jgi:hypothetical protein
MIFFVIDTINDDKNPFFHHKDPIAYPRDYTTVWPFMPKIGYAFEYQVYFMIVCPYLDNQYKAQRSTKLAVYTSSFMLVYCVLFGAFALGAE